MCPISVLYQKTVGQFESSVQTSLCSQNFNSTYLKDTNQELSLGLQCIVTWWVSLLRSMKCFLQKSIDRQQKYIQAKGEYFIFIFYVIGHGRNVGKNIQVSLFF